jgi:ornithine cyclodeaminase
MGAPGPLFISYQDTLELLSIEDAMRVCEEVYRMHARQTIAWSAPPSFKLDVGEPFYNHWHVKGVFLKEVPATGIRLYNYFDNGAQNTVGSLERLGYVLLADPATGHPLALVDEHWSYAVRSVAAPIVACRSLAIKKPRVLGLVGIGNMGTTALRCLTALYGFEEIHCTSRSPKTRGDFAEKWSRQLGIPVRACDNVQAAVTNADIVVGGTTSNEVVCREEWLKPGCLFISLARRELDPAGWARMDKVVVDSWDLNMLMPVFRKIVEARLFSREQLYAEIQEIVAGLKPGRTREDERILVHTCGMASQDIALAHFIYVSASQKGLGIRLPGSQST